MISTHRRFKFVTIFECWIRCAIFVRTTPSADA